jgi:hypothetical protein
MLSHIIGQICQHKSPLLCFIDRGAVDLYVVSLTINIYLLLLVVNDMSWGDNTTVTNAEME